MVLCGACILPGIAALTAVGSSTLIIKKKKEKKNLKGKKRKKTQRKKTMKTKKDLRGGRRRIGTKKDSIRLQKKVQNKYKKCIKSCKTNYCRSKCLKEFHKDWSNKDKYLRGQGRKRKYTSRV